MDLAHEFDLSAQVGDEVLGEHCDAVFSAFGFADIDQVLIEVDVFDPEGGTFGEAESGAIEDARHEEIGAVEVGKDESDLRAGEDDGESFRAFSAGDLADLTEIELEDLLVEEGDGIEGLVLGRGGDIAGLGEVGEEGIDFRGAHGGRVALFVEEDEAFDPGGIGFDGSGAEVSEAGEGTDLVEEFGLRHGMLIDMITGAAHRPWWTPHIASTQHGKWGCNTTCTYSTHAFCDLR